MCAICFGINFMQYPTKNGETNIQIIFVICIDYWLWKKTIGNCVFIYWWFKEKKHKSNSKYFHMTDKFWILTMINLKILFAFWSVYSSKCLPDILGKRLKICKSDNLNQLFASISQHTLKLLKKKKANTLSEIDFIIYCKWRYWNSRILCLRIQSFFFPLHLCKDAWMWDDGGDRDLCVPGWDRSADVPDHQHFLFQQRDLPAWDHFQLLRCKFFFVFIL